MVRAILLLLLFVVCTNLFVGRSVVIKKFTLKSFRKSIDNWTNDIEKRVFCYLI